MSNEKDKATAQAIAARHTSSTHLRSECEQQVLEALTTIREEARRAAFKEVIAMTKSYLRGTLTDGSIPEPAAKTAARRLRALITALEAAEKRERDG